MLFCFIFFWYANGFENKSKVRKKKYTTAVAVAVAAAAAAVEFWKAHKEPCECWGLITSSRAIVEMEEKQQYQLHKHFERNEKTHRFVNWKWGVEKQESESSTYAP